MDNKTRDTRKFLRGLSSEDAANWLMENYNPSISEHNPHPVLLLDCRSWARVDQFQLAHFYLQHIPYADGRIYNSFLTFMSIPNFIKVIKQYQPTDTRRIDLLLYYVAPALMQKQKSEKNAKLVQEYLDGLTELVVDTLRKDRGNCNEFGA